MSFKFFTIPIRDNGAAEGELNAFLRGHRVLGVERRWVDQGQDSFWSFCVDYLDGPQDTAGDRSGTKRGKDYRDLLSPADFAVFAKRVTALLAFTRTPGLDSWHFRRRVLQQTVVSGHEARTG